MSKFRLLRRFSRDNGTRASGNCIVVRPGYAADQILASFSQENCVRAYRASDGAQLGVVAGGDDASTLRMPCGMAVDAARNELYVASTGYCRVSVFSMDTSTTTSDGASGIGIGRFPLVRHIAHTATEYAAGANADRAIAPFFVALDVANGELYVSYASAKRVLAFRMTDGAFLRVVAGEPSSEVQLQWPTRLLFDGSSGLLLLSDYDAHDVLEIQPRDGVLVRSITRGNAPCVNSVTVVPSAHWGDGESGDVLLTSNYMRGSVCAFRLRDSAPLGAAIAEYDVPNCTWDSRFTPAAMATNVDRGELLVSSPQSGDLLVFDMPKRLQWRPDADVHQRFDAAFRLETTTLLAVALRSSTQPWRLPLELLCYTLRLVVG